MRAEGRNDIEAIQALGWERDEHSPRRGALVARHGMVASTNPYTSRVGLEVLQGGGNAVDAAIAMAATHVVVEPNTGHLGGDTFMLVHLAERGETIALNGSGAAPERAERALFEELGGVPAKGPLAACVPGTVHSWGEASRRYGTLPLSDVLAPAAKLARDGFVVQNRLARNLQRSAEVFRSFEGSARQYLDEQGRPPATGDILRQPWLAATLDRLRSEGASDFYEGELADAIVRYWQEIGGLFTHADFARHRTRVERPLRSTYRGYDVVQQPLPSQGLLLLLLLNMMERAPLRRWGVGSADTVHYMLEAKKLAFGLKERYLGDPDRVEVPLERLLDKGFATELADHIDRERAQQVPDVGGVISTDTDYLCVVDEDRNVVSHIHSLFPGCGVTVPGVGALFNSRMLGFRLEADHPNTLEPGKRPLHTLNSWLLCRDGRPLVVGGVTAGDLQVQFNLQIITRLIDGDGQLHEALDAPRWGNLTGRDVLLEERGDDSIATELRRRGHPITAQPAWGATGRAHAIAIDHERGILIGHSEARDDGGFVMGY